MFMRGMLRRLPLVALTLALWIAAEPILHTHSLQASTTSGSSVCAVCATGADRPIATPAVVAPQSVIALVPDAPLVTLRSAAPLRLASRAPPAA